MENLGRVRDITFINDSKATNGEAAARALACYDDIFWIAGGRAKDDGLAVIKPFLPRIRHAFLIGEAGPAVRDLSWADAVPVIAVRRSGDRDQSGLPRRAVTPARDEGHSPAIAGLRLV